MRGGKLHERETRENQRPEKGDNLKEASLTGPREGCRRSGCGREAEQLSHLSSECGWILSISTYSALAMNLNVISTYIFDDHDNNQRHVYYGGLSAYYKMVQVTKLLGCYFVLK